MLTLTIALRNIFRRKTRSIITLSTIAFGCVAIIFVNGFFEDILLNMRESYISAIVGNLQVGKKGVFDKGFAKPLDYIIENPKEIIQVIERLPEVRATNSRLMFSGLLSTGDNSVAFAGQGVEPSKESSILCRNQEDVSRLLRSGIRQPGLAIESGDPLTAADSYSAVLGKGLAKTMDLAVNDNIILLTNTVGGSINAVDMRVKGVFFTAAKSFDDISLRVPLSAAQRLLRTEGINNIVIRLHRTEDTQKVGQALARLFQSGGWDLEIRTWEELSDFYTKTETLFRQLVAVLMFVMIVVVLLSIFSTMNMAVLERTFEIGTLMALGTKRKGILALFMAEGVVLGVLGGLIGVVASIVIVGAVFWIGIPMPPAPGTTFEWLSRPVVQAPMLAFVFLLAVISAIVSSILPAFKASRLEITLALRGGGQ